MRTAAGRLLSPSGGACLRGGIRQCLAVQTDASRGSDRSGLPGERPGDHRRRRSTGAQAPQGQGHEQRCPCSGNRDSCSPARAQRHRDPVRRGPLDPLAAAFRTAVRVRHQDRPAHRTLRADGVYLWLQPRPGPGRTASARRCVGAHAVVRQSPSRGCEQAGSGLPRHHQQLRRPAASQILGRWQERSVASRL